MGARLGERLPFSPAADPRMSAPLSQGWGLGLGSKPIVEGLTKAQVKGKLSQLRREDKATSGGEALRPSASQIESVVTRVVSGMVERVERGDGESASSATIKQSRRAVHEEALDPCPLIHS